jgi:hypothetical protein
MAPASMDLPLRKRRVDRQQTEPNAFEPFIRGASMGPTGPLESSRRYGIGLRGGMLA